MYACAHRVKKLLCVYLQSTEHISGPGRANHPFSAVQKDTWFVGGVNDTSKLEVGSAFYFRKAINI